MKFHLLFAAGFAVAFCAVASAQDSAPEPRGEAPLLKELLVTLEDLQSEPGAGGKTLRDLQD